MDTLIGTAIGWTAKISILGLLSQSTSCQLFSIQCYVAMMSGDLPPAYLVYTTGNGFAPNIEGIPEAMKGLGTMFMLALLTGKLVIFSSRPRITSNSDNLYQTISSTLLYLVWDITLANQSLDGNFFNAKPL